MTVVGLLVLFAVAWSAGAVTCGEDHLGLDWIIAATPATTVPICGKHSNVANFVVNSGVVLAVTPYDGSADSGWYYLTVFNLNADVK